VIDGAFAETKELVAGLLGLAGEVLDEAIERVSGWMVSSCAPTSRTGAAEGPARAVFSALGKVVAPRNVPTGSR
jgi:hypothetical protein